MRILVVGMGSPQTDCHVKLFAENGVMKRAQRANVLAPEHVAVTACRKLAKCNATWKRDMSEDGE